MARPDGSTETVRKLLPYAAVFVVAFGVRLAIPLMGGGLTGLNGYDAGVYYSAADALTHGLLPYRDFALVHPPLIAFLLTPFALLGRLTTDSTGFAAGSLAFMALGALNATLVVAVARRWGCRMRAAVTAGLVYGLCYAAINAEYLTRLEPPGNTLLLLALLALAPVAAGSVRPRHPLLAGLALGAAISVKIWWIVPVLVLFLVTAVVVRRLPRSWTISGWMALGGVLSATAINIVPFAADPRGMIQLVITQQVGRIRTHPSLFLRLAHLLGMGGTSNAPTTRLVEATVIVMLVILAWTAVRALRTPLGRVVVPLLAVQTAVILASPSWFPFYGDYTAVALVLTVAAGIQAPRRVRARRGLAPFAPWLAAAAIVVLGMTAVVTEGAHSVRPLNGLAQLTAATADVPCVMAWTPQALIATNSLDRSFAHGCHNWVDVMGLHLGNHDATDFAALRSHGRTWDQVLAQYFGSGQAAIVVSPGGTPAIVDDLFRTDHVLARDDALTVYRTGQTHTASLFAGPQTSRQQVIPPAE